MTLKSRKTRARSYFYEKPCLRSLFNISTETFNLEYNLISLNLAELLENEFMKSISKKKITNIPFSIQFFAA